MADDRKDFRVIEGGKEKKEKVKPGRVGLAPSGLTLKQEAFAVAVAEGATNSEAYRGNYSCDGMAEQTVWQEACKLRAHPKVAARILDLIEQKGAKQRMETVRNEDRVWRQVWSVLEAADTPAAVRVSAATLAAKLSGMMTEKVEISRPETAGDIERELMQRLAQYK